MGSVRRAVLLHGVVSTGVPTPDSLVATNRRLRRFTIPPLRDGTRYGRLQVCFEACPMGYGLYRLIQELGHDCLVIAPALIPKRAGERVKTNRRDAVTLARLHRRAS